jgi:hypothetical protein
MRMVKRVVSYILIFSVLFSLPLYAAAAPISPPLSEANDITVANNPEGTADIITVGSLTEGDVISIYSDATLKPESCLGTAAAGPDGKAVVTMPQLTPGDIEGYVFITVTVAGMDESAAIIEHIPPVNITKPLTGANIITITNNPLGTDDTIAVNNLKKDDIINVYADPALTLSLGSAIADADGNAVVTVPQLIQDDKAGYVFITVTKMGMFESPSYMVLVTAENASVPLNDGNKITVTNNPEGTDDTVTVDGLTPGDIIIVYSNPDLTSDSSLGSGMANPEGVATITTGQLIPGDLAGYVYITVTKQGMLESTAVTVLVIAANASAPISDNDAIVVINNGLGTNDTLTVNGLSEGDTVRLYADYLLKSYITSALADDKGIATISLPKLTSNDDEGNVYITVIKGTAPESAVHTVLVPAPGTTAVLSVINPVSITNNAAGTNDIITVGGLIQGDIIRVYADEEKTSLLGSGTASVDGIATVTPVQLFANDAPGTVYITNTNIGKIESVTVPVAVPTTSSSIPLSLNNTVTVTNNAAGTADSIVIDGLKPGDKIRVYADRKLTALIGSAAAGAIGIATVTLTQILPGDGEGYVYITVTSIGKPESTAYQAYVPAANATPPLSSANIITVINRVGTSDSIIIEGLNQGDKIKVYSDPTLLNLLGTGTAVLPAKATTATATVNISQLFPNDGGGDVYVTVTNTAKLESTAITVAVTAANTSVKLNTTDNTVTVVNRASGGDSVVVTGLRPGDKIKIYSDSKLTNMLGVATAASSGTATANIAQLTADDGPGTIYITVTSPGLLESGWFAAPVTAAGITPTLPNADNITVTNNALGTNDTIVINSLAAGTKVKVYSDTSLTNLLGTGTASTAGSAKLSIAQLTPNDDDGTVYITLTSNGLLESLPLAVDVYAAKSTAPLNPLFNTILVTNNSVGKNDTISITRLAQGDKIKVYADSALTVLLGTGTAAAAGQVIVSIPQVTPDDAAGDVYITVTNLAATESTAIMVHVEPAGTSVPLDILFNMITVTNNLAGTNDTVSVSRLSQKDVVKVYADAQLTVLLGTAAAANTGTALIKIKQLIPNDKAGTIWLTVTGSSEVESTAISVPVDQVTASDPLSSYNTFTVTNNAAGISDTIVITKLYQGDRIRVYADDNCAVLLGTAVAAAAGPATVKIPQLIRDDGTGVVYVTVTNAGKLESTAYALSVPPAARSYDLTSANIISVTNNAAGTKDTIVIGGLSINDRINVYADANLKHLMGTAKAAASGTATFSTPQLVSKDGVGVVYLTVTNPAFLESNALRVDVGAAKVTAPLDENSTITVTNNAAGSSDTIVIGILAKGDKVKVYSDATLAKLLGSATATDAGTATVTVAQLIPKDAAGHVYITVTNVAACESPAWEVDVPGVKTTASIPDPSLIVVTNNAAGTNDTLVVPGLAKGDKVKVYADAALTSLLGSATANVLGTVGFTATVTVRQLAVGDAHDKVYVTVTNSGARESTAVEVDVPVAKGTVDLSEANEIIAVNNAAGTADIVTVNGLNPGDKIKVYADKRTTALLGSASAAANGTAVVKVSQLIKNDEHGFIYVTVTSFGLKESGGFEVEVSAAGTSDPLVPAVITVTNNAGKSDTVVVTGLEKGDKIRVYSNIKLTNLLGTATTSANGTATVNVSQLIAGDKAGSVYVTVTKAGMRESPFLAVSVEEAGTSKVLTPDAVTATNYALPKSDTVVIVGLLKGDKVKIYSDSKLTKLLGSATASVAGTAAVTVRQLIANDREGDIYITVTSIGMRETTPLQVHVSEALPSDPILKPKN